MVRYLTSMARGNSRRSDRGNHYHLIAPRHLVHPGTIPAISWPVWAWNGGIAARHSTNSERLPRNSPRRNREPPAASLMSQSMGGRPTRLLTTTSPPSRHRRWDSVLGSRDWAAATWAINFYRRHVRARFPGVEHRAAGDLLGQASSPNGDFGRAGTSAVCKKRAALAAALQNSRIQFVARTRRRQRECTRRPAPRRAVRGTRARTRPLIHAEREKQSRRLASLWLERSGVLHASCHHEVCPGQRNPLLLRQARTVVPGAGPFSSRNESADLRSPDQSHGFTCSRPCNPEVSEGEERGRVLATPRAEAAVGAASGSVAIFPRDCVQCVRELMTCV
jgi:hypothetical protein